MNIVFLWDPTLNHDDAGIMLNGRYFISYNRAKNELKVARNNHYVNDFWGKHIQDCFAIVGENSAGKTVLVNRLMEDIRLLKEDPQFAGDLLIVGEAGEELVIFSTGRCAELQVKQKDETIHWKLAARNYSMAYWEKYEIAYFHNMLSQQDYLAQSRCKYDFSLGRMIRRHRDTSYEMHYHDLSRDAIQNYFDHEIFRICSFLYEIVINGNTKIPFPIPKQIRIQVTDEYFSEEYIIAETCKRYTESLVSEDDVRRFKRNIDRITQEFGDTWINGTVKNLILNCYKELCLPETIPGSVTVEPHIFFRACEFLEENRSDEFDAVQYAFGIIRYLQNVVVPEKDRGCLDRVKRFITWLQCNEERIHQWESRMIKRLNVPVDKETEAWMNELLRLYSSMNFVFPFYGFSFGVSTGEYAFLTLFANLHSMVNRDVANRDAANRDVYSLPGLEAKAPSILLIFDEVDLSMHPRWQRMHIKWLTDFCEQIFRDVSVKIIVTTHSPILLSDFPANSILYIEKDQTGRPTFQKRETETFGCNIHSLYLDSFFLESCGTMGLFAEEKINEMANQLLRDSKSEIDYEKMEKMIGYIGEGVIREQLEKRLNGMRQKLVVPVGDASVTLERLLEQRDYLDQMIREIKEMTNDKNQF